MALLDRYSHKSQRQNDYAAFAPMHAERPLPIDQPPQSTVSMQNNQTRANPVGLPSRSNFHRYLQATTRA